MIFLSGCATLSPSSVPPAVVERPDLAHVFRDAGTEGTLIVHDLRKNTALVVNPQRAAMSYPTASTFKVLNSLIALEVGAVRDVDTEIFKWSGKTLPLIPPECNADIPLRAAFKYSCVPVYQELARRIGPEHYDHYLNLTGYGNQRRGNGPIDQFWLDGTLQITAKQQIGFIKRLITEDLPFSPRTFSLLKDIMILENTPEYVLRAKTGFASRLSQPVG